MALIKQRAIVKNSWRNLLDEPDQNADEPVFIDHSRFASEAQYWRDRSGRWGVLIANDMDPSALKDALPYVASIAINFPKYTDGRGYTLARCLRQAGYTGELRAVGDVLHDQLSFMERCGFDAFELKAGKNAEQALDAFGELGRPYQEAADSQTAQWRRFG